MAGPRRPTTAAQPGCERDVDVPPGDQPSELGTVDVGRHPLARCNNGEAATYNFLTYTPGTTTRYMIENVRSGLCLDLSTDDRSRGVRLSQTTCDGSRSQRWYTFQLPGSISGVVNVWTGMCLAGDASASDPQRLRQLPCNRLGNSLVTVQATTTGSERQLRLSAWGECAQVRAASTSSGAAVDHAACNSAASSQRWRLDPV